MWVWFASLMFASFSWTQNSESLYRSNYDEVQRYLQLAIEKPKTSVLKWNVISIRDLDTSVENTFAKWFCTYGAARISPEFFPFISPTQQQRTRGWNAVDRCTNAQVAGYKIWNTPAVGSLVVYNWWWKFWPYWHVSKVLYLNKEIWKVILRDMSRIARFKMTDRRDDINNANFKCFIYNNKTNPNVEVVVENTGSNTISTWTTINSWINNLNTGNIINTWNVIVKTWSVTLNTWSQIKTWNIVINSWNNVNTNTNNNNNNQNNNTSNNTDPISVITGNINTGNIINTWNIVIVEPEIVDDGILAKKINLNFDNVQDPIIEHFLSQYNIAIESKLPEKNLWIWSSEILRITIKEKNTDTDFFWVLPFTFNLLSTNWNININPSYIQLLPQWWLEIKIKWVKQGESTVIINIWDYKIGGINLIVK